MVNSPTPHLPEAAETAALAKAIADVQAAQTRLRLYLLILQDKLTMVGIRE